MLTLSKTTYPQKLFDFDCMTLYGTDLTEVESRDHGGSGANIIIGFLQVRRNIFQMSSNKRIMLKGSNNFFFFFIGRAIKRGSGKGQATRATLS